ncbi:MAG: flagellar protein FliS [Mariniblastus sp.]
MNNFQSYAIDNMVKGWTRADMLVALYEQTISRVQLAKQAKESGDTSQFASNMIEVNRFILALHSGLDYNNCEVAQNVARLLNFVAFRLEEQDFDEAIVFLSKLRATFEQIREEGSELEKSGEIPPLVSSGGVNTVA